MRVSRALIVSLAVLAPTMSAQQFTYSSSTLPAQNLWTDGVVIADMDGDGNNDIVFANGQGYATNGGTLAQQMYLGDGAGNFSNASGALNVANLNAKMAIAEDFDNDGDLDLMFAQTSTWPSPTKKGVLLLNQGGVQGGTEGVFADASANLPNINLCSFSVAAGDVDNDGDLDVVFTDGGTFGGAPSQARLYLNNGSAVFTDATAARLPADLYNCQDVTLFDYNGDWHIDIALSGKGATNKRGRLYINDGTGHFSIDTSMDQVGSGNTYEIDWGDLDGDGDWDAAVQSISGTSEGWARNNGVNTAMNKVTFPSPNGNDDNEMACFDYDLDGDLDVLVGNLNFREKLYQNNGSGVFTNVNTVIQSQSDATLDLALGDLNGDGAIDFVTGQGEGGSFLNKAYLNNGPADTLAPVITGTRHAAAISVPCSVWQIRARDQISDDGHIGVTATFAYTTTGGGGSAGGGTAVHMGGGQYRAEVPTGPATDSVSLTWTLTDGAGNSTVSGPHVVSTSVWANIGSGHPGVSGVPALAGVGKLIAGSAGSLELSSARASAACGLFVGLGNTPVAFYGGTLQTFPFLGPFILATNGSGALSVPWLEWPAGIPGGFQIWFQYAIDDPAAVGGFSLSNALEVTAP